MKASLFSGIIISMILFTTACNDHDAIPDPVELISEEFVNNLTAPIAITKGANDNLWIAELGTGKGKDGTVSLITPDGKVYPVITEFLSVISPEGTPAGLSHMLVKENILYILHGAEGRMYKYDVSGFVPGTSAPIKASTLKFEDIGQFVKDYKFKSDNGETNLFNLTWGFEGDLFITDAAANAIIRRKSNGALSVFHEFPAYPNPGGKPETIDFVPTGIVYDGSKLLVTSLTGFPFMDGKASIQQLDATGNAATYKDGFTTLVDIVLTPSNRPLVIQLAKFSLTTTPPGFVPNSGRVANENGTTVLDGLMMPTDIERTGDRTYYVVSMALGKVTRLTY